MIELSEKGLTLHTPYPITTADTDMYARLRMGALVNLLIQSAIKSAENLGIGLGDLSQHNLFWVLRNLTVELYRPVKWDEKVTVETWPKNVDGILYLRDFVVRDEQSEVVARATSGWLALDRKSKRPKRFDGEELSYLTFLNEKHSLRYRPEKFEAVEGETVAALQPSFFDIDINQHVTSTRYVDWMVDTIPAELLQKAYPTKLSICYLKETMMGDPISINRNEQPKAFMFEGVNGKTSSAAFRGKIEFEIM